MVGAELEARPQVNVGDELVVERSHLQQLFDALAARGYEIFGPTARDGAIILDRISSVYELPVGLTELQERGTYRLEKTGDEALFTYTVGPQSWKKFLYPSRLRLWHAERNPETGFDILEDVEEPAPKAFMGVRACELAALAVHDTVLKSGRYVDPVYKARREGLFIVAVNCGRSAATCFCASMGTGPEARAGYDLALTEIHEAGNHYFVVDVGTERGAELLGDVEHRPAGVENRLAAERACISATAQQREIETEGLRELLQSNLDSPRWDDVAARCLGCTNCTMVCPTCFCTSVEDVTSLSGDQAERWRRWDSCFTTDFSYIHGGSVRASGKSRYRQWMTHKLSTWVDQFGTFGCVGCGRCITWCPVGIDITEEARAIRERASQVKQQV